MNFLLIIVIAIVGIWGLGVFLGVIGGLSKSFTPPASNADSYSAQSQSQQFVDDTAAKEKKMMDDIKQKMDDANVKY